MIKLINFFTKVFNGETFEEGYTYIILDNTEYTKHPEKYSEGVFAWYQDGVLKTSLEFQIDNGGDPIVFKKYLLKEQGVKEAK